MTSRTDLSIGNIHPEVGNWQRFLNEQGMTDALGKPLVADEHFGARTLFATKLWQRLQHLPETGAVDRVTRKLAVDAGFIGFLPAKFYGQHWPKPRHIRLIVIHTAECAEVPEAAESVASYFTNPQRRNPQTGALEPVIASAHYTVDENSVMQSVRDEDVAWHASNVNDYSLGIEHAGRARQTQAEWFDSASRAILARSAKLVASLMRRYNLGHDTVRVLATPEEIREGTARGLCGHVDVTRAFGTRGGHVDPGPHFPWLHYLALVKASL